MNETPASASVLTNDQQPALENPPVKPLATAPKWETAARDRMRAAIKKFSKPLADLVARDANEGDTRLLVMDMLCEGFGFDKYAELTTSGVVWQVYHITGGLPIVVDLALEVDLFGEEPLAQKANQLYYLTKESLKRRQIDTLWQAKRATSPKSLATVLCSENVVTAIRKELKRTTGQSVTDEEILKLLSATVLRPECLGSK